MDNEGLFPAGATLVPEYASASEKRPKQSAEVN